MNRRYTYVTLLGTDDYLLGTLCLWKSLCNVNSKYPLLVLCSQNISTNILSILEKMKIQYRVLGEQIITNHKNEGKYARWSFTFDKLQIFNLIEYEKIVFLDSDMFVVKNIDCLFNAQHMSAVVADIYDQPECKELNSGLMVVVPSEREYKELISVLHSKVIKKLPMCGDQDIIRQYYNNWSNKTTLKLPNQYNMYFTNIKKCKWGGVSVIHFVYDKKPWKFSWTAFIRRMLRFNAFYLSRYMLLVYLFKNKVIIK